MKKVFLQRKGTKNAICTSKKRIGLLPVRFSISATRMRSKLSYPTPNAACHAAPLAGGSSEDACFFSPVSIKHGHYPKNEHGGVNEA
jgi:hypothetical protein